MEPETLSLFERILANETVQYHLAWPLGVAAGFCLLRAAVIFLFWVPARAKLIDDGYRRAGNERNAAVFQKERAPMPLAVEDAFAFTTHEGRSMKVLNWRLAWPQAEPLLVWYSPRNPNRISAAGPLKWLARSLTCFATLIWLLWD